MVSFGDLPDLDVTNVIRTTFLKAKAYSKNFPIGSVPCVLYEEALLMLAFFLNISLVVFFEFQKVKLLNVAITHYMKQSVFMNSKIAKSRQLSAERVQG